ncbi:transmembrane protein 147 [Lingula anatina]|uniref:BOS complex subunit TMEM147 n=1 Tax=Lingula anatina TaxID=7574 RepID=A0A1S3HR39_LINAN|nr:transmembrane protein 147 [Lingula anatina]|eukprot:XP_013388016.1 transmembrane protein 147 [Lingula anatina]
MTLFHFLNCLALSYVPYMITYKCSGLAEYSAFWKCVQAGVAYMITQLCKMLVLATFFPATELSGAAVGFDVVGEFLKSTIDLADLVGIHLVMTRVAGKGQLKFMIASMGWATAELIVTRCLPLWVGARGVEFDWKYIQMSFDSNISLVQHITTAALVWLYSRNDLNKAHVPVVMLLLALSCYKPLIVEILIHAVGLGSWTLLLAKVLFTSCVGVIALQVYLGLSQGTYTNSYN